MVWRAAVPHGKSVIGPSSLSYSSNGEDVSFPQDMGLTLPVREHKNSGGSHGTQRVRTPSTIGKELVEIPPPRFFKAMALSGEPH